MESFASEGLPVSTLSYPQSGLLRELTSHQHSTNASKWHEQFDGYAMDIKDRASRYVREGLIDYSNR